MLSLPPKRSRRINTIWPSLRTRGLRSMAGLKVSCCRLVPSAFTTQVVAVFIGALSRGPVSGAVAVENLLAGEGLAVGAKTLCGHRADRPVVHPGPGYPLLYSQECGGPCRWCGRTPRYPRWVAIQPACWPTEAPAGKQQFCRPVKGWGLYVVELRHQCRRRLWSAGKFCR